MTKIWGVICEGVLRVLVVHLFVGGENNGQVAGQLLNVRPQQGVEEGGPGRRQVKTIVKETRPILFKRIKAKVDIRSYLIIKLSSTFVLMLLIFSIR